MQKEIEKILCNLIQQSLNLPDNYGKDAQGNVIPCVTIRGQNIKLFNTPHIQITVQTVSNQVFANRKEYFEETTKDETTGEEITTYYERLKLNDQRQMQIDIYSRNNEARERYWEVQAALTSTLAEQLQDKYQFRLGKISNSFNTSGLEGGSDINRNYYSTFETTAQSDKSSFADYVITIADTSYLSFPDYHTIRSGKG